MKAPDLVSHFLAGGQDPERIRAQLQAAWEKDLQPRHELPVVAASVAQLQMLVAIDRGPQWRCTQCGYLQPYDWRKPFYKDEQRACANGTLCHWNRYHKNPKRMLLQHPGRDRDWYLETARLCGLVDLTEWREGMDTVAQQLAAR